MSGEERNGFSCASMEVPNWDATVEVVAWFWIGLGSGALVEPSELPSLPSLPSFAMEKDESWDGFEGRWTFFSLIPFYNI